MHNDLFFQYNDRLYLTFWRLKTADNISMVSFDIFNKLLVVVKVKAELRSLLPGQSWPEGEC